MSVWFSDGLMNGFAWNRHFVNKSHEIFFKYDNFLINIYLKNNDFGREKDCFCKE